MPDTLPADPPLDELFSAAYEELRRLASLVRSDDPAATLSPTTLVNEAFLKLAAAPRFKVFSPLHFRRIVARAMRQVLVEAARRRNAAKRGGDLVFVQLDEAIAGGVSSAGDILGPPEYRHRAIETWPNLAAPGPLCRGGSRNVGRLRDRQQAGDASGQLSARRT